MIYEGEDELICDFAETYRRYDYRALPQSLAATLAAGLSDDSRIKRKLVGQRVTTETVLLSLIVDEINFLLWQNSGCSGSQPKRLTDKLLGEDEEMMIFDSPEAYEEWRNTL